MLQLRVLAVQVKGNVNRQSGVEFISLIYK